MSIRNFDTPVAEEQIDARDDLAVSLAVRRFLGDHGIRAHNHASEVARILGIDRSQSYRRFKGEVAWNHADLRCIAAHFGAPPDSLLHQASAHEVHGGHAAMVPAALHLPRLPSSALIAPGACLSADDRCDLVAVPTARGWEVWFDGEQPPGAPRHAIESLMLSSRPRLRVALLEDDALAAATMVEALQPHGIDANAFARAEALLEAARDVRFDAFVLDWLLPGGTADRAVVEIRRHRPQAPMVVVTGALAADAGMERTLLELSARWNFSTFDKPVRPMNLANALKQLVSAARG